ncbi:MAG: sulfatase-like hydrolase/transferase [Terrimonas sp.]|nr:sulfatase-like hydrolase/transferase [Terrimonas sp.]
MKRLFEKYPFFLVLLPLFVVIHLEKELHRLIPYHFVYDRILLFFCIPLLLTIFFLPIFRSLKKSALLSFVCSLFIFFLGDAKNSLSRYYPESMIQKYSVLLSASLLVLVVIIIRLKRSRSNFRKISLVLNTTLLLFITADVIAILFLERKNTYTMREEEIQLQNSCGDCEKPDIYYIIFDSYTSSAALAKDFNYSNAGLEHYLQDKGFFIASQSKSNYNYTAFSLGSIFNLNYFEQIDTTHKLYDRTYLQALKIVYQNKLFPFLRQEGYQIFNHSLFDIKGFPTTRTVKDKWGIRELFDQYNIILKLNADAGELFPKWINRELSENDLYVNTRANRKFIDSMVMEDLLQSVQEQSSQPKFVYAHFLSPHPPFFNDSLGRPLISKNLPYPADIIDGYVNRVAAANRKITRLMDSILKHTQRPLVIIIQGDHGFTYENDPEKKREKYFPNMNAFYFSNRDYHLLNDSLTSVNTFRVVLNTWFKKELPILQNEFYFLK